MKRIVAAEMAVFVAAHDDVRAAVGDAFELAHFLFFFFSKKGTAAFGVGKGKNLLSWWGWCCLVAWLVVLRREVGW